MIRRILRSNTSTRIAVLVCAFAPLLMMREANAQEALTRPAGLPDWAFNIPDKEQPSAVRPEGKRMCTVSSQSGCGTGTRFW